MKQKESLFVDYWGLVLISLTLYIYHRNHLRQLWLGSDRVFTNKTFSAGLDAAIDKFPLL